MRLDKYLKISRLIKRRTVANEACDAGRVMINDKVAKASADVKIGDVIEIAFGQKTVKKLKFIDFGVVDPHVPELPFQVGRDAGQSDDHLIVFFFPI